MDLHLIIMGWRLNFDVFNIFAFNNRDFSRSFQIQLQHALIYASGKILPFIWKISASDFYSQKSENLLSFNEVQRLTNVDFDLKIFILSISHKVILIDLCTDSELFWI